MKINLSKKNITVAIKFPLSDNSFVQNKTNRENLKPKFPQEYSN